MQLDYYRLLLVILIIISIISTILTRNKINKFINKDNVNKLTEAIKDNLFDIKKVIIWYKNYSPQTIILVSFIIFTFIIMRFLTERFMFMYFISFLIGILVSKPIFKWILEFTTLFMVDIGKNPNEVALYLTSYRIRDRFKLIDDDNKPSIMTHSFKSKKGRGFFINSIDKKNKIIKVNTIHNNIDLVVNLKNAYLDIREKYISLKHQFNNLKGRMEVMVLDEAIDIVESTEMTRQLMKEIKKQDISNLSEKDIIALADEIKVLEAAKNEQPN